MSTHDSIYTDTPKNPESSPDRVAKQSRRHPWRKAGIITLCILGAVILLIGAAIGIGSWWLSSPRLTNLVNKELSKRLDADVIAHNVNYKIWSTFPYLELEMDSIAIYSRALDKIPAQMADSLPADAKFLMKAGHTVAGINVRQLFSDDVDISRVIVDQLRLNLLSVNDSIANYNIFPKLRNRHPRKLPYISFDQIKFSRPDLIRYRNLSREADIRVSLDSLMASKLTADNQYLLNVSGKTDASVDGNHLLRELPMVISGELALNFQPLEVSTKKLDVKIANMSSRLSTTFAMADVPVIKNLSYDIKEFNLNGLLQYLSSDGIPAIQNLNADFYLSGHADLLRPYNLADTLHLLPSAQVELVVPSGNIAYIDKQLGLIDLSDINLVGTLTTDGDHPEKSTLLLRKLNIGGDGTDLAVNGKVTDLLADPRIQANVRGVARMEVIGHSIEALRKMNLSGNFVTDTRLDLRLSHLRGGEIEKMRISGKSKLNAFHASNVGPISRLKVDNITLDFNGDANTLTTDAIQGTLFDVDLTSDLVTVQAPGVKGDLADFKLKSSVVDHGTLAFSDAATTLPIKLQVSTGAVNLVAPKDTLSVHVRNTTVGGLISPVNPSKGVKRNLALNVKGDLLNYTHGSTSIDIDHVLADLKGSSLAKAVKVPLFHAPEEWSVDDYTQSFVRSMPRTLAFNLPKSARDFLTKWEWEASLKMDRGMILVPAFPVRNYLRDIDVYANLDSINVRSFTIHSLKSGATLQMAVSNLRQFLLNPEPAPLLLDIVADVDTVQINQLAATYERGVTNTQGAGEIERRLAHTAITPADSVAVAIPRNIFAKVNASIKQTEYGNVHFFDIAGNMLVKNGRLLVDTISAKAPFGSAGGRLFFDSSDIENLYANLRIGNLNLDITEFFNTFPKLVAMMPQVKNLSGNIGAGASVHLRAFPTMFADVPALNADLLVTAKDLELKQDEFIHHITSMLLIPGHDPIDIENMTIHAAVRDNLLMLYPFNFRFKDYHLTMTGLNNFGGDIFYHIGVDKSPLHIPFGINIKGQFHHPVLRFGGAKWKNSEGTQITSNIMDKMSINLIQTVRNANNKFIHKAAEGAHTPESEYVNFK